MSQNGLRPAVVVTGATSGIGRAMAKVAARERRIVVLIGRSPERLDLVAGEVREQGGEPVVLNLDLLAQDATRRVQDFLLEQRLVCDILVNSAGLGFQGLSASNPVDAQLAVIDLNARALVELSLALIPAMVARRGGGVINLGSVAGMIPGPQMAVYYASKSFVASFSQALYQELRPTGVTVTCAVPGPVETEFLEGRGIKQLPIFTSLPALSAEEVAESAWQGFKKGRRLVVPGLASKIAAAAISIMPLRFALPLIDALQRRNNDKCPCGSGKKFRNCCGSAPRRRWPSKSVLPKSRKRAGDQASPS
jgi:hypothetical protein